MPNKKILHIIDTTGPGGAETVFIQLADKLRSRGWESIVVIRGPGWVQDQLEARGLKPVVVPVEGGFAFKLLLSLLKLIREHNVSIIQSHLLGSNIYAGMAGMLTGVPVVATYHGMVDVSPSERLRGLKHWVMQRGIKRYIAVSQQLMHSIARQGLLDSRRSKVIYNGVDLEKYKNVSSSRIREMLSLDTSTILIGSLGNIRPAKAYGVLISAAKIVVESNEKAHFVIAGHKKPQLMAELDKQIELLGLQNNIHFIGFCDNSAEFLSQIDIFALSSSSEGFSISTIEAMASKCPVVVTQCGGPEEIATQGETALMVPIQAPTEFAKAVMRLLGDKTLARKLACAGYEHCRSTFDLDIMIEAYEKTYVELLGDYREN